ncbi:N-acetyl-alpha-D-glucosaminyl L-malate synthase BshA [Alicyclobacillaceae bacterium I2511]|nr:N-acetyl-alpha-D-glucosaminyl L-malate synthase BshA [Alicyclobacillaceae bacterium I2511]
MRIGISCYPTVGGSGAVATELGKALAHKGHQVHFIVTDVPFRLGEFHQNIFVHEEDTSTYPVLRTPLYDLSLAALMARTIREQNLDILHVHYALPFAVCAFLAKQMTENHHCKVVTTLHGTDITVLAQDSSLYDVIQLGIARSDAVTAVSYSLAEQTQVLFPHSPSIQTIHNFVDPDVFRPVCHPDMRRCFAADDEKILLHISNFRAVKRVTDVVRVFVRVQERVKSRLLLVGEGPEEGAARNLVQELDLASKVRFLGRQDEVADLFATADLLLLPSQKESFGLVALEAMSTGVPVVGSRAGGIPEVVAHGKTGFLTEIGDIATMSEEAIRLLTDDELYHRMSVAGRERAQTQFHIQDKVAEYESLYVSLLDVAGKK